MNKENRLFIFCVSMLLLYSAWFTVMTLEVYTSSIVMYNFLHILVITIYMLAITLYALLGVVGLLWIAIIDN